MRSFVAAYRTKGERFFMGVILFVGLATFGKTTRASFNQWIRRSSQ